MTETWETTEIRQRIPIGNHMELRVDGYRDAREVMQWYWQLSALRSSADAPMEIVSGDLRDATTPEIARAAAIEACSAWLGNITGSLAHAYTHQRTACIDAPLQDFDAGDDATPWSVTQHIEEIRRGPFTLTLQAQTECFMHGGQSSESRSWYVNLAYYNARTAFSLQPLLLGEHRLSWRPQSLAREDAKNWARELMQTFRNPFEDGTPEGST